MFDDLGHKAVMKRREEGKMPGATMPRDPDEYEGVPLSLGRTDPAPSTDRPRDAEVAFALAGAIAQADNVSLQNVLDWLDGYTRSSRPPERAGTAAAEAAAAMIRGLLEAQGRP